MPAPQGVQLGASVELLKDPASQIPHDVAFVWGSVTFWKPALQVEPAPANTHLSEPGADTKVPPQGRQSPREELPKPGLKVFAGHGICRVEFRGQ